MNPRPAVRKGSAPYRRSLIGVLMALVVTVATYYSGGCTIQRNGLYFNCSKEK